MKPVWFGALKSEYYQNTSFFQNLSCPAELVGNVYEQGNEYSVAKVVLFDRVTFLPLAVRVPDDRRAYAFRSLQKGMRCFVVGFDEKREYNAVIEDNVVV